jgi:hypothetical protein
MEDEKKEFAPKLLLGPSDSIRLHEGELLVLARYWANKLEYDHVFAFLICDIDHDMYYSDRLNRIENLVGREAIQEFVNEASERWKLENPTLWKLWYDGTQDDGHFVMRIFERAVSTGRPVVVGSRFDGAIMPNPPVAVRFDSESEIYGPDTLYLEELVKAALENGGDSPPTTPEYSESQ